MAREALLSGTPFRLSSEGGAVAVAIGNPLVLSCSKRRAGYKCNRGCGTPNSSLSQNRCQENTGKAPLRKIAGVTERWSLAPSNGWREGILLTNFAQGTFPPAAIRATVTPNRSGAFLLLNQEVNSFKYRCRCVNEISAPSAIYAVKRRPVSSSVDNPPARIGVNFCRYGKRR